ncbi:MAG TPA: hypothetical protein DIT54_08855 [Lachnospiraceae bacterium]|nr:hypothetical protein [Lachnospiraceae bacterium]
MLEEQIKLNENSILVTTNPFLLLLGIGMICLIGILCARRYRNTNDFAKSIRLYIPMMLGISLLFFFGFQLDILLVIGIDFCGFIAMALASNYYFYH